MVIDDEGDDPYDPIRPEDHPGYRRRGRGLTETEKAMIRAVYNRVAHRHLDDICYFLEEEYGLEVTGEQVMAVVDEATSTGGVHLIVEAPSDRQPPGR